MWVWKTSSSCWVGMSCPATFAGLSSAFILVTPGGPITKSSISHLCGTVLTSATATSVPLRSSSEPRLSHVRGIFMGRAVPQAVLRLVRLSRPLLSPLLTERFPIGMPSTPCGPRITYALARQESVSMGRLPHSLRHVFVGLVRCTLSLGMASHLTPPLV